MNDRYLIALSYGLSWLLLGWGTYGLLQVKRWLRRRRSGGAVSAATVVHEDTRAILFVGAHFRLMDRAQSQRANKLRSPQPLRINEVISQNAVEIIRQRQLHS